MNTNNFSKKYLSIIVIVSISIIIVIFWCCKNTKNYQQNKETLSNVESKKEEIRFLKPKSKEIEILEPKSEQPKSQKNKNETKQPKLLITQTHFDQIKNYIFSENDDKILLLNNLSQIEQEQIEKIKNSWKFKLSLLKKQQNDNNIIETNKECDDFKTQIELLQPKKKQLEKQLEPKELEKDNLNNKINEMRKTKKSLNKSEKKSIETQIEKLQDEEIELVNQITKIKTEITNLEIEQEYYQSMLSRAENTRDVYKQEYKNSESQFKNLILSDLNEFYQITN